MDKIKYFGYKYAPESIKVYVNNKLLNTDNTMINYHIMCGRDADAIKEIKTLYRAQNNKKNRFCYGFTAAGSKTFYYITALSFTESENISRRLYCYKELKNHLKNNPPQIVIEEGHVTPEGASKPTTKTVDIDFSKLLKIKLI